jgi:hypothetical protein
VTALPILFHKAASFECGEEAAHRRLVKVERVGEVGDGCGTVGVAECNKEGGGSVDGPNGGIIAAGRECGALAEGAV